MKNDSHTRWISSRGPATPAAIGVDLDGHRDVLGLWAGSREDVLTSRARMAR